MELADTNAQNGAGDDRPRIARLAMVCSEDFHCMP